MMVGYFNLSNLKNVRYCKLIFICAIEHVLNYQVCSWNINIGKRNLFQSKNK